MPLPCQAVDFLRRRYAAAILRDDMDTACRVRLQLDAIMNRALPDYRPGAGVPAPRAAAAPDAGAPPARAGLRLLVTAPVTGLREQRRY